MLRFCFIFLTFLAVPHLAFSAHPHYERLLDQGTYALEQGELQEAIRDLRLACFGLLEEPSKLAMCLTRLAVAQAAIDDDEGFLETFRRVGEVEERFGAYAEAPIAPETRARFEAAVIARIPPRTLEATRAFAHLLAAGTTEGPATQASVEPPAAPPSPPDPPPAPEESPEQAPAREQPPEQSPPPRETPAEIADEAPPEDPGEPPQGESPAEPPPVPEAAADEAPPELGAEERETLQRAYQLLSQARTREALEEPYRLAREVADANPAARGAQHLAAVIAYRSARWDEAVRYFRRGGDPGEGDPETLFYLAVSLYEAGEPEAAATALRRSLPRIERTPFVRSYESKILGAGGGS